MFCHRKRPSSPRERALDLQNRRETRAGTRSPAQGERARLLSRTRLAKHRGKFQGERSTNVRLPAPDGVAVKGREFGGSEGAMLSSRSKPYVRRVPCR